MVQTQVHNARRRLVVRLCQGADLVALVQVDELEDGLLAAQTGDVDGLAPMDILTTRECRSQQRVLLENVDDSRLVFVLLDLFRFVLE